MADILAKAESMDELRIVLPWPPSVNHYWRNFRGRMVIGAKGRAYRHAVIASVIEQNVPRDRISCRLAVSIDAYPPDNRRRDIDNINKALLDAIVAAEVIEDDGLIDALSIIRFDAEKDGRVEVRIREYAKVV